MTSAEFSKLVLMLPATVAAPHFECTAFRIVGKKIFASLLESAASANIALPPDEQAEICRLSNGAASPLENAFGRKGWTSFDLENAAADLVLAALETAHAAVLKSKK